MEPFYTDENCIIYCGDAAKVVEALESGIANLIVTDPPYGQGFVSGKNSHAPIHGDDGSVDVRTIIDRAARRLLARGRHAYVFGPIDLRGTCLTAQTEIIWDKESVGMGDLQSPWGLSHERITFAVQEISAANRAKGYGNLSARIRKGSVIRATKRTGDAAHRHPTEKPVSVLRQLIESSSVMGETVLDPFMGSGSTLEAAALEGRFGIGIEIDPEHCRKAAERMRSLCNIKDVKA